MSGERLQDHWSSGLVVMMFHCKNNTHGIVVSREMSYYLLSYSISIISHITVPFAAFYLMLI